MQDSIVFINYLLYKVLSVNQLTYHFKVQTIIENKQMVL